MDFDAHDDNMPVTDVVELTGVDVPDAAAETDPQVYSFLGYCAVCVLVWESYGYDRCSILVLTGVLKFI